MTGRPDPIQSALLGLVLGLAPLMPSAAAAPAASREWRVARRNWLIAMEELCVTEDWVRATELQIRDDIYHDVLAAADPRGEA